MREKPQLSFMLVMQESAGWTYQCSIHDFHREILPSMVFDSKNLHTRKIAQKAGKSETALKTTKVSYDRKKGVAGKHEENLGKRDAQKISTLKAR